MHRYGQSVLTTGAICTHMLIPKQGLSSIHDMNPAPDDLAPQAYSYFHAFNMYALINNPFIPSDSKLCCHMTVHMSYLSPSPHLFAVGFSAVCRIWWSALSANGFPFCLSWELSKLLCFCSVFFPALMSMRHLMRANRSTNELVFRSLIRRIALDNLITAWFEGFSSWVTLAK